MLASRRSCQALMGALLGAVLVGQIGACPDNAAVGSGGTCECDAGFACATCHAGGNCNSTATWGCNGGAVWSFSAVSNLGNSLEACVNTTSYCDVPASDGNYAAFRADCTAKFLGDECDIPDDMSQYCEDYTCPSSRGPVCGTRFAPTAAPTAAPTPPEQSSEEEIFWLKTGVIVLGILVCCCCWWFCIQPCMYHAEATSLPHLGDGKPFAKARSWCRSGRY